MRLTIVGSGTLVPDGVRCSPAHLLSGSGFELLLDCGSGTVHGLQRQELDWPGLTHLALTHFHTDHVGDLPALMWALTHARPGPRVTPLVVLGPPGIRGFMARLTDTFGSFVLDPGFDVEVVELARRDAWADPHGRFDLETHPTIHTEVSLAYKVRAAGQTVSYTGDTGPDEGLFQFFAGSDVVVAECSHPDPPKMDTHLTPAGIAALGLIAAPGRIVTTHVYAPLEPATVPERVRHSGYAGVVVPGIDGLVVDISEPD